MGRRKKTPDEVKNPTGLNSIERGMAKAYVSLDDYTRASVDNPATEHTKAHWSRDFRNLLPGISGRPGLTREDYDYFRPEEATPRKFCEIMRKSNEVYRTNGLIRNVIDLMGDFTTQGVRVVHPNKRIEAFHKSLWEIWRGTWVTERIANTLYRLANVPIQYYTTKLTSGELEKLYLSTASPDKKGLPPRIPQMESRELPYKYVILDPASVTPVGGALSSFLNQPRYGLILSPQLMAKIKAPATPEERDIVAKLPEDIIEAAKSNKPYLLDPAKTVMLYYKKDDWQMYADPMIYAILDDIEILEKLKLADLSALDGATSKIRIFKLGSMEHKVAPSPALADKLSEILQNNVGAGVTDIVWGPDIEILETDTSSYSFLGNAKYEGTLNNIYAGMGIPPTLTGTFGANGTTNNFISLKTLTERLEYGRSVIVEFWNQQFKIVQKVMGFRFPAKIVFDRMILGNEDAEKALLIQLADRNLISDEMLQNVFKNDPEMERIRLKREKQERKVGKRVPKAGAYHNTPEPQVEYAKIALQAGMVTPSEVGLELEEKKPGEVSMMEQDKQLQEKTITMQKQTKMAACPPGSKPKPKAKIGLRPKGRSGQGRPKGKKDSKKRKTRTFRARSMIESWARSSQNTISDILAPAILETFGKKNMRQLSTEQAADAENIKFGVLCSYKPLSVIDEASVAKAINSSVPSEAKDLYNTCVGDFVKNMGRQPTLEECRNIQINVYTSIMLDEGEDNG